MDWVGAWDLLMEGEEGGREGKKQGKGEKEAWWWDVGVCWVA